MDRLAFEDVLVTCLSRIETEGDSGLEAVCSEYPAYADQLRRRVRVLRDAGLLVALDARFPDRLGEFQLLELIGQGGMGVVFRAEQLPLGREVALKVVRHERLLDRHARRRFAREVQTLACLAHPGIVPVHAVGEQDGFPFFAMEYVRGVSLERAVRALEGRSPAQLLGRDLLAQARAAHPDDSDAAVEAAAHPAFAGPWSSACLWVVREAAQALEHAHQHGVLHRDVKTSNIMLTGSGRVLLLDFGLARAATGSVSITRTGAQLGSWHYMPPELVAGTGEHGAPTDVYSLGVTLYELLTLRLPFAAPKLEQLQAAILDGRPRPARQFVPGIPRDVESVLSKAMAPEPERRYASAADFARDLTHLLERRPVEARPRGPWLHLLRWTQRHRGAAAAVAIAGVAAIVGPTAFGLQQWRMNERLREERETAKLNLDVALKAVEEMLLERSAEHLADPERVSALRRRLLTEAGDVDLESAEPALERLKMRVNVNLARLDILLGDGGAAEAILLEQVEAGERLLASEVRADGDLDLLAGALHGLALRRFDQTDAAGALELAERGLLAFENAAADEQRHMEVQLQLTRAQALADLLRPVEAREAVETAVAVARLRRAAHPRELRTGRDLADALDKLGTLTAPTDLGRAAVALEEAWQLRLALFDAHPQVPNVRLQLCRTATNASASFHRLGRPEDSRAVLERALDVGRELVEEYPGVPSYAGSLAGLWTNLSALLGSLGSNEEALAAVEQALPILRELALLEPESAMRAHWLAGALVQESNALKELGRFDAAQAALGEALLLHRDVVSRRPTREYRFHLGVALANEASLAVSTGRYGEAPALLREALPLVNGQGPHVYFLAAQWIRAARAAETDTSLGAAELDDRIQGYYGQSLELLRLAVEQGFVDRGGQLAGNEWDPLRGDERFEALCASARR